MEFASMIPHLLMIRFTEITIYNKKILKNRPLIHFAGVGLGGRKTRRREKKESYFTVLSSILDASGSDASSMFPITAV